MVFWVKTIDDKILRLEDTEWKNSIYLSSLQIDIKQIVHRIVNGIGPFIHNYEFDYKSEFMQNSDSMGNEFKVIKINLAKPLSSVYVANYIENNHQNVFRFYNVDILPEQSYFYSKDIFPLIFSTTECDGSGNIEWHINKSLDDVWLCDYHLPDFKSIDLIVIPNKNEKITKFTDRLDSIVIRHNKEITEIRSESESETLHTFIKELQKVDPDFIFTDNGDSFDFPYLLARAKANDIPLFINREKAVALEKTYNRDITYFSYGKTYFRPAAMRLLGRIHIDLSNSFFISHTKGNERLHGLYEISRICRIPLHLASRASIGRCMSSLQFYYAIKRNLLIPWKPAIPEIFKTGRELLFVDRGGLIFEPLVGVHEQVAEFDFASLYPNIMRKKNISAETTNCACCPDSSLRVPELNYPICEKKEGLVAKSLKILLEKREQYKKLMKSLPINSKEKEIYDARQSALKWILVTSFGYLGFSNAKFGRIDAHIAVCAFARQILLHAAKIAEREGFTIVHGIIDSLWIKKRNSTKEISNSKRKGKDLWHNCFCLKETIEKETGFEISFEGIYRWIVFPPSAQSSIIPVPNRYFGLLEDEKGNCTFKVRGIESRRHDTPILFSKFQEELLQILSKGKDMSEVKLLLPKSKELFLQYIQKLKQREISFEELVFTKVCSKNFEQYNLDNNRVENDVLIQLHEAGISIKGGQIIRYIITDYYGKGNRAIPIQLINSDRTRYDVKRYCELMGEIYRSTVGLFY